MVERIKSKDNTENIGICFEPLSPGCCFPEAWEQAWSARPWNLMTAILTSTAP